ncbi:MULTISPECIES: polysaccharide pyruvyl transferase family protein [unclassified Coleofasciculus]|uniref:polysaccharide pyruvyl transferase family protein n=1 Tax=unclassified Coleofasciculus TaxID=2692782 RepID=UPI0018808922|nr:MULTISPECIES: polysaccharide pyruvyl transferase family protein [unclassified Coleofasciculus]MBE9126147.1 polysaccharide pyruvyl transferase family protein [Coleofasciculus sp. LEGE 07081]MBE9149565.1 polysaccharide pyruvyl transferase family protein [Coleofasciculus sp. LEGE 07092]
MIQKTMKKITVLGNFSGRNAGDAAILGNLLKDISAVHPDALFVIPTLNPQFIYRHFGHYNIKPLGLMPWNGAIKIFGLSTFRAMLQTDLVLVTDNILFDRKLLNPLFNYLSTISLIAPACQRRGIPIALYNASLGPITTPLGKQALQRVLDASPLLILRDRQSKELLDKLELTYQDVHINADCAINTTPPPRERMDEIVNREGLFKNPNGTLGFNINAYIDSWSKDNKSFGREQFLQIIGSTLDRLIEELDIDILYTITQVMDTKITNESLKYVKRRDRIQVVSNANYTYQEIAGLLERVDVHVGMRTHSLILASAVLTPILGINSYPKTAGFMQTIDQDKWAIDFDKLTPENLTNLIKRAWKQRHETQAAMAPLVQREQAKALSSVALISNLLGHRVQPERQLTA